MVAEDEAAAIHRKRRELRRHSRSGRAGRSASCHTRPPRIIPTNLAFPPRGQTLATARLASVLPALCASCLLYKTVISLPLSCAPYFIKNKYSEAWWGEGDGADGADGAWAEGWADGGWEE